MVPPLSGDPPSPSEPPTAAGDLLPPAAVQAPSCSLVALAGDQTAGDLGLTSPGRRPDGTRNDAIAHTTAVGLLLLVLSFCVLHQAARQKPWTEAEKGSRTEARQQGMKKKARQGNTEPRIEATARKLRCFFLTEPTITVNNG